MPKNRIYIPTFISSVTYAPARVLPHLYFYNGLKICEPYYIEGYANGNTGSVVSYEQNFFPYFDNYEGQNPTSGSRSLLFFNEPAVYGTTPTGSLYTDYWQNYINLLYNPTTRLVNCEAIIPLADYFKMELNDIVEWRGNYYHLRAINEYNLSNGECKLQLLGPILGDILPDIIPAIACDFNYTISAPCSQSFEVGDTAFGGVVAYVDVTGCNGFVVSTGSVGTGSCFSGPAGCIEWGCRETSSIIIEANNYGIGYGWLNTQKILGQCNERPIAASAAAAYTSNGFGNWCLPNLTELQEIANNKTTLKAAGVNICDTGACGVSNYWTSNTNNTIQSGFLSAFSIDMEVPQLSFSDPRDLDIQALAIRYFGDCFTPITTTTTTCAPSGSTTTTTTSTTSTTSTTTTTIAPTTTTTTNPYFLFGNCGRGNSVSEACSDAIDNARNFYSDCNSMSFGTGCVVYVDNAGTILTGYTRIFMNGSNWDISSTTGVVSGASSTQC